MTSWSPSWKCDVKSKIRLRQSMRIEHSRQISSDLKRRSLKFFWRQSPNKKNKKKNNNYKASSDMTSVSDLIIGSEGKSVSYQDECYSRIVYNRFSRSSSFVTTILPLCSDKVELIKFLMDIGLSLQQFNRCDCICRIGFIPIHVRWSSSAVFRRPSKRTSS